MTAIIQIMTVNVAGQMENQYAQINVIDVGMVILKANVNIMNNLKQCNMENIFEGAKFGDKFVTKDGQVAIYHGYFHGFHCLNIEGVAKHIKCFENGKSCLTEGMPGTNWSDIVSRYNRHIVEEKTDKFIKEAYIELYNVLYNNTKVVKVVKF